MSESLRLAGGVLLVAAAMVGACAEERHPPPEQPPVAAKPAKPAQPAPTIAKNATTTRAAASRPLVAVDGRREGGTLVLADLEGRRLALVADEDGAALRVMDTRTLDELAAYPLPGRPAQLAVAGDGRVYVALRDMAQVVALEVAAVNADEGGAAISLRDAGSFSTATEPLALASSPDGQSLWVVSGWGRRLQGYALKTGQRSVDVQLPPEPRAVTISDDGTLAFVSHAIGSTITRVALKEADQPKTALWVGGSDQPTQAASGLIGILGSKDPFPTFDFKGIGDGGGSPRHAVQGFALASFRGDVLAPMVLAHPGEQAFGGYGTSFGFSAHQPVLAVVRDGQDEVTLRAANRVFDASTRRLGGAGDFGNKACFLPRALAIAPKRALILISCLGSNRVEAFQATDKSLVRSMTARWLVPSGPTGLAVNGAAGEALVWSQFAGMLSALPLPPMPAEQEVGTTFAQLPRPQAPARVKKMSIMTRTIEAPSLTAAARRGRELFHGAGDGRIAGDGRACASCHPDGRADGISWPSPQGRSQTPILAGRLGEEMAPYGWNGESSSVARHVSHTFKRLGGRGLKGEEMAALLAYLQEMPPPPSHTASSENTLVARGKQLFEAETVGCAVCHKNGDGSDGAGHTVGSGRKLDTPSLRYIGGSAPYFHDGRYATLAELLRETKGKMGWAPDMNEQDLEAIEAYLMTL